MSSDFERLLRQGRDALPGPDKAVTRRARERAQAAIRSGRGFRLRSALALAAAFVAAVGAGVGIGALVVPSGSAAPAPVGLGFLPAQGWEVAQNGGDRPPLSRALAVAANVPLSPDDDPDGLPFSTLVTLPPDGIVIFAEFTSLGEHAGSDPLFRARTLPLKVREAVPHIDWSAQVRPERPLGQYQLRAAVNGYAVDVQIYFGAPRPSSALLAAAQRQLDRLVVAPERVTIFARSSTLGRDEPVELFGSVDNGKQGEVVGIHARDCGQRSFRGVSGATTRAGGAWSTQYFTGITTTLRAVWNDVTSAEVTVRQRAIVNLRKLRPGYQVTVTAKAPLWKKRVLIQRYNRRTGTWVDVRRIVLTEQVASGVFVHFYAKFRLSLPRGTLVRAFFPLSEARPCYLAGVSRLVRT